MLSNLINNAIESDDNPKVSIEIFEENNQIKLQIKDNGPGIPQSIIDNLGKEIITTKDKGNGLGLNHAINTVKDLNANLNFESSENGTIITNQIVSQSNNQLNNRFVKTNQPSLCNISPTSLFILEKPKIFFPRSFNELPK